MLRGVFKAPSSSANVGPGYDVFSMALEKPFLTVEISVDEGDEIVVVNKGRYAGLMSTIPEKNAGAVAATKLLQKKGLRKKVELVFYADIPPRKGLGASGAEAAAAVFGLNKLLSIGMKPHELVEAAAAAEPGGHPDNVAASLLGGFVACLREGEGLSVLKINPPEDLGIVVIVPDVSKESTALARKAVPEKLSLETHVEVVSRVGVAALALCRGNLDLFLRAVYRDPFVEYFRAEAGVYGEGVDGRKLLTEKERLLKKYNVAEVVSGAGPSRVLFYKISENSQQKGMRSVDAAVEEVVEGFKAAGYSVSEIFETRPSLTGCMQTA
ncbi:MAG: hypothetical protein QW470_05120 [Candidatus Caldarchaeum sp.]